MTLKNGLYYIGDPTFLIPDQKAQFLWGTFLGNCQVLNDGFSHDSYKFICGNTGGGPGAYRDQFGNIYGVDSGCLSVIPMKLARLIAKDDSYIENIVRFSQNNDNKLCLVKRFDYDFEALFYNGSFKVDSIVINT